MDGYHVLWTSLQLSMLLWMSIWICVDFYGYPCIELLWILDPGMEEVGVKTWSFIPDECLYQTLHNYGDNIVFHSCHPNAVST